MINTLWEFWILAYYRNYCFKGSLKGIQGTDYWNMKECGWISKVLWQKPEPKDYMLYESIHMTFQKGQDNKNEKQTNICQGR